MAYAPRTSVRIHTRYADDLTFSGDAEFARSVERFIHLAVDIAMDESFHVSVKKTRVMRAHADKRCWASS